MVDFGTRILLLTGSATAIAIGAVLASGGFVDVRLGELSSGVVTGLSLLILSLVTAVWYEAQESGSNP